MNSSKAMRTLDALRHWEKLEDLGARFAVPHIPEYELEYFKNLYYFELREALTALDAELKSSPSARAHAERGRVRRLFGDLRGALEDLQKALDLEPELALAQAWLGELDLQRPEALVSLGRALELEPDLACARLYRGAARLLAGELSGAAEDLEAFAGLAPESALGYLLLGLIEERRGQRARAAKAYEAAASKNPVCSAAYLLRSRSASGEKDAARWFREAYNVSPVLGFITLQVDRAYQVEGARYVKRIREFCFKNPEKVGAYYRREATQSHFSHFPAEDYAFVSRLAKDHPEVSWAHGFYGRAACYVPEGAAEGVRHLSKAIELCPHAGWLYAWRANARRVRGELQEALEDFNSSARLQPFYHRAFVWRGSLYRKLGRLPEALADLDRALAMDPYYSLTYYERSMTRRGLGDLIGSALDLDRAFMLDHRYSWVFKTGGAPGPAEFEKGLRELDAAIEAHPNVVSFWVWRGQLKMQQMDFSAAFEDLERAVELDPQSALAWAWYGAAQLQAGQAERAAELLARAVALDPRFWIAYNWLAQAEAQRGKKAAAQAALAYVLKAKPKTPWVWFLKAKFLLDGGRPKPALAALKRALLLDGKYPEAYLLLARARLAAKDLRGALTAVNQCIEIAPNMGRAFLLRAEIHQRAGRSAEVLKDYATVLKSFPYLFNDRQRAEVERALAGEAAKKEESLAA